MVRRSILAEDDATEINLSSMIDCIFILLIFFIVTTVFVEEQGIQVSKPDAAAAQPVDENDERLSLWIGADNKVSFEDEEILVADIAARIRAKLAGPDTPVTIRAHEKSSHATFVSVWDAAKRGGAQALSFTTEN